MKLAAKLRLLLTALSFEQKDAVQTLKNLDISLTEHCLYLYLYQGAQEQNHWAKEIAGYSKTIFTRTQLKRNKRLSKELFDKYLVEDPIGEEQDYVAMCRVCQKHMELRPVTNLQASYGDFLPKYKAFVTLMYSDVQTSTEVVAFWL